MCNALQNNYFFLFFFLYISFLKLQINTIFLFTRFKSYISHTQYHILYYKLPSALDLVSRLGQMPEKKHIVEENSTEYIYFRSTFRGYKNFKKNPRIKFYSFI